MRNRMNPALKVMAASLFLTAAGCASVQVNTKQELGLPLYAATDPAFVELLTAPPEKTFTKIGEITLQPSGDISAEKLNDKMKTAAAKIGADAVVLKSDRTEETGIMTGGLRFGGEIAPQTQRVITGDAIKYTQVALRGLGDSTASTDHGVIQGRAFQQEEPRPLLRRDGNGDVILDTQDRPLLRQE